MRGLFLLAIVLTSMGVAVAQDQTTNPDELNRKYQDALSQLKAAQDRKNELATENEKLTARVNELEKQLEQAQANAAELARQTFPLRSFNAAWQVFMRRNPRLHEQWKMFLDRNPLAIPSEIPQPLDTADPFLLSQ